MEIDESGNVIIKGRHDVGNNRFRRFSMTIKAPENTDMKRVAGNIEGGLYTVVFPKIEVPEAVQEGTEPEKKQLDAGVDEKTDKGIEAALDNEPSNTVEKAAADERVPATAGKKTEAVTVMETVFKKTNDTNIPEAEKVTKAQDEIVTKEPETILKPPETSDEQGQQTISKAPEASAQKEETATKPTKTAPSVLETLATALENPTTKMGTTATALPEMNSLSMIPKTDVPPEPKKTPIVQTNKVKFAINNEQQEHQEIKKEGGFLDNVIEMITEHKACIVSVILAFSMGILISRRISS